MDHTGESFSFDSVFGHRTKLQHFSSQNMQDFLTPNLTKSKWTCKSFHLNQAITFPWGFKL